MTWQVENLGFNTLQLSPASSLVQCTNFTTPHGRPDLQNEETKARNFIVLLIYSQANSFMRSLST